MLGEIKALLLRQGRLEIARFADQPGLALLADTTFEQRFDEDELMPIDEILDLALACSGPRTSEVGKST